MEILLGMQGNSLFLYQLSLTTWKPHYINFVLVHILKFPDSRQNSVPFF